MRKESTLQTEISEDVRDRKRWLTDPYRQIDSVTSAEIGSFWARSLPQYEEILTHSGATNVFSYAQSNLPENFTLVDAGCGAGYALVNLRQWIKNATLIGVDIRNSRLFTLIDRYGIRYSVDNLFKQNKIQFVQNSILNINKIVPQGFHVLVSVGGFYDESSSINLQIHALSTLIKGLKPKGVIQILLYTNNETFNMFMGKLRMLDVPFSWNDTDPHYLRRNNFPETGKSGILTLGLK